VIPAPQRIEFASLDGTPLVATFYPPAHSGAPGLLLIHMLGSSREVWDPYALRWQDPQNGPAGGFAVLAIDLRGHGESGGGRDRAAMVGDGSAALALLRTLPDVDADRIAIIGASIGADVAVDACAGGCVAAASLSPGGFSDVPYRQALEVLAAAQGPVVLCVAAQEDAPSPQTCDEGQGAGLADYRVQLYEGSAHGTDMLGENYDPPLFELLTAFLSEIAEP
jgi:pimeloyl-ACP methyl ester carboxylesterase